MQCSSCWDATEHWEDFFVISLRRNFKGQLIHGLWRYLEILQHLILLGWECKRQRNEPSWKSSGKSSRVEKCNTNLIVPLCDVLFPVVNYCLRNLTWAAEKGSCGIQVLVLALQDRAALAVAGHGAVRVRLLRGAAGPEAAPGQGGHPCQDTAHSLCQVCEGKLRTG